MSKPHPNAMMRKEMLALLRALRKMASEKPDLALFNAREDGCEPLNIFLHRRKLVREAQRRAAKR